MTTLSPRSSARSLAARDPPVWCLSREHSQISPPHSLTSCIPPPDIKCKVYLSRPLSCNYRLGRKKSRKLWNNLSQQINTTLSTNFPLGIISPLARPHKIIYPLARPHRIIFPLVSPHMIVSLLVSPHRILSLLVQQEKVWKEKITPLLGFLQVLKKHGAGLNCSCS